MLSLIFATVVAQRVGASLTILDPSDVIPPKLWAADNAIFADYNVPFISTQPTDINATNVVSGTSESYDHVTLTAATNDTSVLLVRQEGQATLSYVDIIKTGYASNLLWSSFYGFNAAVNVANASTAELDHVNITVHNGAANVYSYGTNTVVNISNSWLYSSGPVSHGLYASGNGTVYGRNLAHFSGGMRSSSFSGDSPAGYVWVWDSVAHTQGIGSATYYGLGQVVAENVVSLSENGPVLFMDGPQLVNLTKCDATAGLLGGAVIFSSQTRESGATVNLEDTQFTTKGKTVPGLWFGNVIANVSMKNFKLKTESGILAVANYSQITQDFDYYAGYVDNNGLQPAEAYLNVEESQLVGDLVAYNGSFISLSLNEYSSWKGIPYSGYGAASFDISLDATSSWTVTRATTVRNLVNGDSSFKNVHSNGFPVYYNASTKQNSWLGGKTYSLNGGGSVQPIKS